MATLNLLRFQKIHLVVLKTELFLQSSDGSRPRVHFLPHSLLDQNLRLDNPTAVGRLLLLIDQTGDYLSPKAVDKLILGEFFHFRHCQLADILPSDSLEIFEVVVVEEVIISTVEPFSLLHLLEGVGVLIRIVLYCGLDVPNLRAVGLWLEPEEDIELDLPILVLEDVVPMSLNGCEELKPTLS